MSNCFMLNGHISEGGGNTHPGGQPIIVRRNAAMGDVVCSTVIADALVQQGYKVTYQCHHEFHPVLKHHPRISGLSSTGWRAHVDLDGCYEKHPEKRKKHFHTMFFERAQQQLKPLGIDLGPVTNCRPELTVPDNVRKITRDNLSKYDRPWVLICPRSDFFQARTIPDCIWQDAAEGIKGTKMWVGRLPAPPGIVDLKCRSIEQVMGAISVADLMVTVDTGPMHLAAALGLPLVCIYQASNPELHLNDQNDFVTISSGIDCLGCMENICPKNQHMPPCQQVNPGKLAELVNQRLKSVTSEEVSAVVCIYQPKVETLNKCLNHLLPKVNEIVVSREAGGTVPAGTLEHPRIHHVRKSESKIGYGRNANFGARHTHGKYIWFVNDDLYVDGNCLQHLMKEMHPDVGMVGHLIRYTNGKLYHAGKPRGPGGFFMLDHGQYMPSITEPLEVENVTGTSILVRRKAFYQAHCHDEDFMFYAEDDALCMQMRQAGWKIRYTPHATAVHENHASTSKLANVSQIMHQSNQLFGRKWNWYIQKNKDNRGLGVFQ